MSAENTKSLTGLILAGALYMPDDSVCEVFTRENPEWDRIEHYIRLMERFLWPGFWLYRNDSTPDANVLQLTGGKGEYYICFHTGGERDQHYLDEARSKTIIRIWESDLGLEVSEKLLCNDLELVLTIVRHFLETGERHPHVDWTEEMYMYM